MHLTKSEIILYTTQFGLTESKRHDVENHLLLCEDCTARHKQYADEIQAMITENELECQAIEDDLVDFLLGDVPPDRKQSIERHLETCESCRFLYDYLKNFAADLMEQPTSGGISLTKKMPRYLAQLKETFGTIVNLTIEPLPAAPVFLGNHPQPGLKTLSHNGGSICLATQKPFQKVSLFTSENLELKTLKADEFGVVVFEDYLPGKYQVGVEGFEVKSIKYPPLSGNPTKNI